MPLSSWSQVQALKRQYEYAGYKLLSSVATLLLDIEPSGNMFKFRISNF